MSKQVLLINDMPGYGKVALSAMIPVLSHMGHHVYNLPTALVSNTLDYGKFDILETTDYMINTIGVWQELGFSFDAVSTGFIVSEKQAGIIAEFCRKQKEEGSMVFADPIMGDEGRLYNGITDKTISYMREIVKVSDYIVPNYTEAVYLAGAEYREDGMDEQEADTLVEQLLSIGARSIVITSALVNHEEAVIVYDSSKRERHILPFTSIPVRFPGTGDIFSSVFMGNILAGQGIVQSAQRAMDSVKSMIEKNRDNRDKFKGIPVESFLGVLDE